MQGMYVPLRLIAILAALSPLTACAPVPDPVCQSNSTTGTNATKVRMTWYANWEGGNNPPFSLANLSWSQYNRVSYSFL